MIRKAFLIALGFSVCLSACEKAPDTRTQKALQRENDELRRENASLRNQLDGLRAKKPQPPQQQQSAKPTPPSAVDKAVTDKKGFSTVPKTAAAEKLVGGETRTYTVQQGDTLISISRKIYNNPDRWKDIADANQNALGGSTALKIGQVLILPQ